jgi:hypothetical protein
MAESCQIPLQVLDVEAATNPVIGTLCDYWSTLAGGRPPPRADFDFMKIYKTAPNLLMAERVGPQTFKFIYCGTQVADNFPRDLTGATYGPTTPRVSRIDWPVFFSEVLDGPCLRYGREQIDWVNEEHRDILYGACPLLGRNGRPAYVVACLVFVERSPFDPRGA